MPASDSHAPTPPADTPNAATPVPPHGTWSGRFAEPMSERMQRFNASVDFDQRLARADIAGSLAHARMLAAQGILPRDDLAAIERGLAAIGREIDSGEFQWQRALEDVHFNIERRLTALVGDAASDCTPRARATTRWRPTCGYGCAARSTRCATRSLPFAARCWISPSVMRTRSCRGSRTCRWRNRSRSGIT